MPRQPKSPNGTHRKREAIPGADMVRIRIPVALQRRMFAFTDRYQAKVELRNGQDGFSTFTRDLLIAAMAAGIGPTRAFVYAHHPAIRGMAALMDSLKPKPDRPYRDTRPKRSAA